MIRSFHIGVKALIVKEGKVLVLKEKDIRGTGDEIYDLPGGRIEDEESPEETLGREIKEELGVENFEIKDGIVNSNSGVLNENCQSPL